MTPCWGILLLFTLFAHPATGFVWCSGSQFCVAYQVDSDNFQATISGPVASGYVALGFTDVPGKMGPADVVLAWLYNGIPQLKGGTTTGDHQLTGQDSSSSYTIVMGEMANGNTMITFRRALNTSNPNDRVISSTAPINVIWATCMTPPGSPTSPNLVEHDNEGSTTLPIPNRLCDGPSFCLEWVLQASDGTTNASITFTIMANVSGYVAIGFSDLAGSMGPADAYVGWVDVAGVAHVGDFSTTSNHTINALDPQQDATNVMGLKANGMLSVTFTRLLDTGDSNDRPILNATMNVTYSFSNSLPSMVSGSLILPAHSSDARGTLQLNFLDPQYSAATDDPSDDGDDAEDEMLWIPVVDVVAFVAAVLLGGLLARCVPGIGRALSYHPFPPVRSNVFHRYVLLDLIPAMADLSIGEMFVCALWLIGLLLLLLSPAGDPLGRLCAFAIGTAVLPVTKNSIWVALVGCSFERALKFHRWAARSLLILLISHLVVQCLDKGWLVLSAVADDSGAGWVFGLSAYVVLQSISLLTLEPIRRRAYELFYYTHFLVLAGIALAMAHSYAVCYAMIPSLVLYLVDKAVVTYRLATLSRRVVATHVSGATSLEIASPNVSFQPGQYFLLLIPAISPTQQHPFSPIGTAESETLTFLIKTMGPKSWTGQVAHAALSGKGLSARLNGPYGSLSVERLEKYRAVYLVAGGVGVTPIASIATALLQANPTDLKVHFIWTQREEHAFYEWIPKLLLDLDAHASFTVSLYTTANPLQAQSPAALSDDLEAKPVAGAPLFAPAEASRIRNLVQLGRPNWASLLSLHEQLGARAAVVVCGPEEMKVEVQRIAQTKGYAFHKETFLL